LCDAHEIDQPQWLNLTSIEAAFDFADKVGYPVLVRPSYVLSGAAMNVAYSAGELAKHLAEAEEVSADKPVVITEFIEGGREIDVDAVADNGEVIAHAISEHVENAGIHSGDATLMLPTQTIPLEEMKLVRETIRKIGKQWWPFRSQVLCTPVLCTSVLCTPVLYTPVLYTPVLGTSTVQTRYTHGTHTSMAHI
jgi:carbamoylphosphate synthase large subunit